MGDKIEIYKKEIERLKKENQLLKKGRKYGIVWEEEEVDLSNEIHIEEDINKRILKDKLYPNHIIIEGDNLDSLRFLFQDYKNKIHQIYIDPPYNTSKKTFKYNDNFSDKKYTYIHSKWLSYMKVRLELAKELLKEDGVIFISIDDNEYAQLKLLCDQIFEEDNYIGNIIWDKSNPKGDSKTIASRTE